MTSHWHIFEIHNKPGIGFEQLTIANVDPAPGPGSPNIRDIDIGDVQWGILATHATI